MLIHTGIMETRRDPCIYSSKKMIRYHKCISSSLMDRIKSTSRCRGWNIRNYGICDRESHLPRCESEWRQQEKGSGSVLRVLISPVMLICDQHKFGNIASCIKPPVSDENRNALANYIRRDVSLGAEVEPHDC